MSLKTQKKGKTGIHALGIVAQKILHWGMQDISAENDDGIDALLLVQKNHKSTGQIVHVQVKHGASFYKKPTKAVPDRFGVLIGASNIERHNKLWNSVPGPCILVYVNDDLDCFWTDLRNEDSYSSTNKSVILIPRVNQIKENSGGELRSLPGSIQCTFKLENCKQDSKFNSFVRLKSPLISEAREYYLDWKNADLKERTNPRLGEVFISRVGWRHITRSSRGYESIKNSLLLLGAAKSIILKIVKAYQTTAPEITIKNNKEVFKDFLSLRAKVKVGENMRNVQVILKRKRVRDTINGHTEQKIWFYSVFEFK